MFATYRTVRLCEGIFVFICLLIFSRHAQILASLKSWCHWLSHLHTISIKNAYYESQCRELTTGLMVAVAPVIKESNAHSDNSSPGHANGNKPNLNSLVHSASHFMVTLTGTVRPPSIWKVKEFTDLYSCVHALNLPPEDLR